MATLLKHCWLELSPTGETVIFCDLGTVEIRCKMPDASKAQDLRSLLMIRAQRYKDGIQRELIDEALDFCEKGNP